MRLLFLAILCGGLTSFSAPLEPVTRVRGTLLYPDGTQVPMTWWRSGGVLARVEGPDLVVYREPEVWLVGKGGVARHLVDPGPSLGFHLPLVLYRGDLTWPQDVLGLEIGKEAEFVRDQGLAAEPGTDGQQNYLYQKDGIEVRLEFAGGRPVGVEIRRDGAWVLRLDYGDYETGLPVTWSLFEPPPGVRFEG
jgi:hypothetical protein